MRNVANLPFGINHIQQPNTDKFTTKTLMLLFEAINIYGMKGFWELGAYVLIGV